MADAYFLNQREIQKLRRIIQRVDGGTALSFSPTRQSPLSPLPTLAKANAAVSALSLGTFKLQSNKPDSLADSGNTRDAYALGDLSQDDLAALYRATGDQSGGYWFAMPIGAITSGGNSGCLCDLVNWMLANMTLTTQAEDDLLDIWTGCGCGTECSSCDNGVAAAEYELAITGMPVDNPYSGSISNACWDAMVSWLETPRTATPVNCELLFDFGTLSCEGDDYTFSNNTPNGIKVYVANKLPQPLSNPAKQVYKNGSHSPSLMPAFSIDTITTSTNCLDVRDWTETTASTTFGVPVTFTLTPK